MLFRRALKVVNGASGNLPPDGLNITSENPVYVVGPFNATNAAFAANHAPAAIIADAVTLLSPNWADQNSFANPNNPGARARTTTYYRFATIAGKNRTFPWAGDQLRRGVLPGLRHRRRHAQLPAHARGQRPDAELPRLDGRAFYYSRQAVGVYKCCTNVYSPPTRAYNFDIEFLTPTLLPPKTPMFRDVNTTGFMQVTAALTRAPTPRA